MRKTILALALILLLTGCNVNHNEQTTPYDEKKGVDTSEPPPATQTNGQSDDDNKGDYVTDDDELPIGYIDFYDYLDGKHQIVYEKGFQTINGTTSNAPVLKEGMVPVFFDDDEYWWGLGIEYWRIAENAEQWYDYSTDVKRWANAMTEDGSMWVWIPRFAYRIASGLHVDEEIKGTIEIQFIDMNNKTKIGDIISTQYPEVSGDAMLDFVVHPAFTADLANGGWDKDISGLWVSKFQIGEWIDPGEIYSKPYHLAARELQIGQAYNEGFDFDRDKESHMIKNSEWGAVVYLSSSAYGTPEDAIHRNIEEYTGGGGYDFDYIDNVLQTTTGNVYGVYDMTGGGGNLVAAYAPDPKLSQMIEAVGNMEVGGYTADEIFMTVSKDATHPNQSTKYITLYTWAEDGDNYEANGYNSENQKFGDAIYETSSSGDVMTVQGSSWGGGSSMFPRDRSIPGFTDSLSAYFVRGGLPYHKSFVGPYSYEVFDAAKEAFFGYHIALVVE